MTRPTGRSGSIFRLTRLIQASGALVVLAILLAGVPLALAHYVGWPLPHRVPTFAQLRAGLTQYGVPSSLVIKALAVVCWVAWAALAASVLAEVASLARGRTAPRMALAGPLQPLAAVLVTAIALGFSAPAGHAPDSPTPLHLALAARTPSAIGERVLNHDQLARLTGLAGPAATVAPTTATEMVTTPSPGVLPVDRASPAITLYVVQRGDTLWSIARDTLGEPLRWREIYALNEGRAQPGGAVLDNPHWIYPGWTIEVPIAGLAGLPPSGSSPPVTPQAAPLVVPPASVVAPNAAVRPPTPPPVPRAAAAGHRGPGRIGGAPASTHGRHVADKAPEPVRLPSGSFVGGSFAAGVLSAVALGRLRRRHAYRYQPPEPGRDLSPPPLQPTLRHLAWAAAGDADDGETLLADRVSSDIGGRGSDAARTTWGPGELGFGLDDVERRQHPGRLELGTRDSQGVTVEVTDLSGIAICGPVADDVARALLAGLVARAGPGGAEVLCTGVLAGRLLPGLGPLPAIRLVTPSEDMASVVEAERIARTRRLDTAGAPDAKRFRVQHPENPLPLLLVLADGPSDESAGRWAALGVGAPRLAIAVIYLGDTPAANGRVVLDDTRKVTEAAQAALAGRLRGAQLFGLGAEEAVEVLGALADAAAADSDSEQTGTAEHLGVREPGDGTGGAVSSPHAADLVWPEPAAGDDAAEQAARPIRVEVLGAMQITAFGQPVATGFRSRAKALLAWYLCRPEGASAEQAVDALWPDMPPEAVLRQFWRALGDLRAALRGPGGETPEVLEKSGERYRAATGEIACDLWDFQAALGAAARAEDDKAARQALCRAVDGYRGDLLDGMGDQWVEPVRQDLHRRALDAHLRLSELEEAAGRSDSAAATLERAIELDCYAEEPYRRLMTLHGARGRLDAVGSTWRQLNFRLAELDLDAEPASACLYRSLTAGEETDAHRPAGLPS